MKPKSNVRLSMGGSSILMIFVVLCLTTFAMLSYITGNADCKISTKNAETVKNYYKAYGLVQARLEQLDSALLTAKSDAKQAVDANTYDNLKNKALYQGNAGLQKIFSSSLTKDQKYAVCYRAFSQVLVARCSGVSVEAEQEGDDTPSCSLTSDADQNRQIQVKLTINPYASADRYQITGEKLVNTAVNREEEETLQVWRGSSAVE